MNIFYDEQGIEKKASQSEEPNKILAHCRTGELKNTGEATSQRKFHRELASRFKKKINVDEVYELFVCTIGQLLISLAWFLRQVGYLLA